MVPEGPYSGPVHIPGMTICWGRGVEVVGEGGWEEGVVVLDGYYDLLGKSTAEKERERIRSMLE